MIEHVRFSFPNFSTEVNQALVAQSAAERRAIPGSSLGCMRGGWASVKQLARHWSGEMAQVALAFRGMCPEEVFEKEDGYVTGGSVWAWHVQLGYHEYVDVHDHHQALWSGVYYPAGIYRHEGGQLIFSEEGYELAIEPAEGLLVTFPPTLQHRTGRNMDVANLRYSISFNLHPAGQSGA